MTPLPLTPRRRKTLAIVTGAVALVVCLAALGLAWFFAGDAPDAVDLDTAASGVVPGSSATSELDATAGGAATGIAGTWSVDTTSTGGAADQATGTFAGFRIAEELRSVGATEAVGRTGDVTGALAIEGTTVTSASFTVDLTTITTDERRRDDKVQSALETDEFPKATFALTAPIALDPDAAAGAAVAVDATGDLTIHGVTRRVTLPIEAKLVDRTIVLVGSLRLSFSDYGVEVPSSPVVLSVDDEGTLEVQLLLVRR